MLKSTKAKEERDENDTHNGYYEWGKRKKTTQKSKCLDYNLLLKQQVETAFLVVIFEILLDKKVHNHA